ncbi:hypothetical protein YC2023_055367 [Brassica napus]
MKSLAFSSLRTVLDDPGATSQSDLSRSLPIQSDPLERHTKVARDLSPGDTKNRPWSDLPERHLQVAPRYFAAENHDFSRTFLQFILDSLLRIVSRLKVDSLIDHLPSLVRCLITQGLIPMPMRWEGSQSKNNEAIVYCNLQENKGSKYVSKFRKSTKQHNFCEKDEMKRKFFQRINVNNIVNKSCSQSLTIPLSCLERVYRPRDVVRWTSIRKKKKIMLEGLMVPPSNEILNLLSVKTRRHRMPRQKVMRSGADTCSYK